MSKRLKKIDLFGFLEGKRLLNKYEVVSKLGEGWEGEVYLIRELSTGIEKAAKFLFPDKNIRNKNAKLYANKLHKLRQCPSVIKYYTQESIIYKRTPVTFLVSEYVEGELLSEFIKKQPGKRLKPFQALYLLYALTAAIESMHLLKEYHGDLHDDNIIVERYGLGFDLKIIDMFHLQAPRRENMQDDICDMIRIFYDVMGAAQRYTTLPKEIKAIICGLKRSLILKKFRSATHLKAHIRALEWGKPEKNNI